MDEKTSNMLPRGRKPATRRSRAVIAVALFGTLCIYVFYQFGFPASQPRPDSWMPKSQDELIQTGGKLVPLEAHIMSKCPDARDCLRDMVLPAMQRVHDKVDFTLSFIGKPTDNDGVACKHGPAECLGNIIELCAQQLYPDPKTYLGFTMCLTRDYKEIPQRSLIEDCALEHAINFDALNECATKDDGAYGIGMLRGSVRRSSNVGHAFSPGIVISI
ncbi:hypothetical protein BR93DRAFT_965219 [Coniochaeta sp. PMI_546]|nr:hypothetical protein BR93DRAFT_965219 [Coniochaeta sp. PMI_546]